MSGVAMNFRQASAYRLLLAGRDKGDNPHGVMTSGPTAVYDGQAWVNWQTAEGLERRGLVRIERCPPEGADIFVPSPCYREQRMTPKVAHGLLDKIEREASE